MLHIEIHGRAPLNLKTLVLDYNGTIARDGALIDGVAKRIRQLAESLRIVVLTANTHGSVAAAVRDLPVEVMILHTAHRNISGASCGGHDVAGSTPDINIMESQRDTPPAGSAQKENVQGKDLTGKETTYAAKEEPNPHEARFSEAEAKLQVLVQLGATQCVAMGNGRNDALMLKEAALSIAITGTEGTSTAALIAAQVAIHNINDGLDLLLHPARLKATLRN
ncbi:HAD family hydrolase [Oleidesulfovibrio sp.]|uniref:HAD family hydrolase n=1 Tax=Oleidesulfovibrio sp. TaxID=2909707 RepID=UPI003A88185A